MTGIESTWELIIDGQEPNLHASRRLKSKNSFDSNDGFCILDNSISMLPCGIGYEKPLALLKRGCCYTIELYINELIQGIILEFKFIYLFISICISSFNLLFNFLI